MASAAPASSSMDRGRAAFFRGCYGDNYDLVSHLGRGAYGEVWSAKERASGEKVAIKKIANCFGRATEAKRILREVRILRHLSHPHVISIRDMLRPETEEKFSDLWVVFDFVDLDLRKLINSPQTISIDHVKFISHQILAALDYLHAAHVLHRDLKPANVLLSGNCEVKICDFGLARVVHEEDWDRNEALRGPHPLSRQSSSTPASSTAALVASCPKVTRQMTTHVVTRWYRAPELILLNRYTTAIDIWSFACIFAELLTMLPQGPAERNALFPGRSCNPLSPNDDDFSTPASLDQLNVILAVIGTPSGPFHWVERDDMRQHLASLEPIEPTPFEDLLPGSPPPAIAFMRELLQFKPSRRPSARAAMAHPFYDGMANRSEVVSNVRPVDAATFDFEHSENRLAALRRKLLREIGHYQADVAAVGAEGGSHGAGSGVPGAAVAAAAAVATTTTAAGQATAATSGAATATTTAAAAKQTRGAAGAEGGDSGVPPPAAKRPRRSSRERVTGPSPLPTPQYHPTPTTSGDGA